MNVASLELCKELYELSGWWVDTVHESVYQRGSNMVFGHKSLKLHKGDIPGYDLGFLLRKLPAGTHINRTIFTNRPDYEAWVDTTRYATSADTPEDAAAKLAIELFKAGVLTRGES